MPPNTPRRDADSAASFARLALNEADLMRRVLDPPRFPDWLGRGLPSIPHDGTPWFIAPVPRDRRDGKLAHLDGLNLSRAWMLRGIASALPPGQARRRSLLADSERHAVSGLAAVTGEHYAGGHWLASFATYLLTDRGLTAEVQR